MFFSRKPKAPPARLIQKHEYLDLLQGGTEDCAASVAVQRAALELAQGRRASLNLQAWPAFDPARMFARRCQPQGELLVHVPLGPDNCFFIAVFEDGAPAPQAFFLLDIGAEYLTPMLECPELGPTGPATEDNIRRWIPLLASHASSFAIIELRAQTYMQVYADAKGFHLEHQLVTTAAHYRRPEAVGVEEAIDTLVSYAFGKYEWAYKGWEHMAL